MTASLDTQLVILGTLIAMLRREFPPVAINNQILGGIKIAKQIMVDADIARNAGDKLVIEELAARYFSQPQWAAKEGADKNLRATATDRAPWVPIYAAYTVPGNKTLHICGLSFFIAVHGDAVSPSADYDHLFYGWAQIYNYTTGEILADLGGVGGGGLPFPKPIPVEGGNVLWVYLIPYANLNTDLAVSAWGYEL